VKAGDNYLAGGGGFEATVPLTSEVGVFLGGDYRQRVYSKQNDFEFSRLDGRVGLQYAKGDNIYRASLGRGRFYLDNRYNYEATAAGLEWRHAVNDRNVASIVGIYNRLRFPDPTLTGNNANQTIIGAGWAHAFNAQGTTFVFGSITGGRERTPTTGSTASAASEACASPANTASTLSGRPT
jgi:hypothetical protein